jgi:hypothetical protein
MDRRTTTPESLPATSARPTALELLPSFRRHLAAENKAPRTAQAYTEGVSRLHEFLVAQGMPVQVAGITREHVESFLADRSLGSRPRAPGPAMPRSVSSSGGSRTKARSGSRFWRDTGAFWRLRSISN